MGALVTAVDSSGMGVPDHGDRARFGVGTPREAAAGGYWCIFMRINGIVAIILAVVCEDRRMDHELAA